MMLCTGVMNSWPDVVQASLGEASQLLHQTAEMLFRPVPIGLLIVAAIFIVFISNLMRERAILHTPSGSTWLVASAALTTTLWVDGLFLLTAFVQPRLSGLI